MKIPESSGGRSYHPLPRVSSRANLPAMCTHYRKDARPTFDFIQHTRRKAKIPEDSQRDCSEHTYPKSLAPIVLTEGGVESVAIIPWGVLMKLKGATKDIIKPVVNARSDKLAGFTWRRATRERRCLIPATGYYEPGPGPTGARGEVVFTVKDRPAFFFAGLWDSHHDGSGRGFTMVTTEPNDYVRPFHDRMPVILTDDEADEWLGDQPLADDRLAALCRGLPSEALLHEIIPARPKEEIPPKLTVKRPAPRESSDDQPSLF